LKIKVTESPDRELVVLDLGLLLKKSTGSEKLKKKEVMAGS